MADIVLTCEQCGNHITVSEYVDADSLVCAKCQHVVPVPPRTPETSLSAKLKMASPPTALPEEGPSEAVPVRRKSRPGKRIRRRRSGGVSPVVWGYATFILLSAALLYLRFSPGAMPPARLELLTTAAIAALGLLHLSVIAYAFADDAFHGVLCALIPGYSIYYLFTEADQFLLRAVVASLLLAFGLDTLQFVRRVSTDVYVGVSSWIQDTDSLNKDRYLQIK